MGGNCTMLGQVCRVQCVPVSDCSCRTWSPSLGQFARPAQLLLWQPLLIANTSRISSWDCASSEESANAWCSRALPQLCSRVVSFTFKDACAASFAAVTAAWPQGIPFNFKCLHGTSTESSHELSCLQQSLRSPLLIRSPSGVHDGKSIREYAAVYSQLAKT